MIQGTQCKIERTRRVRIYRLPLLLLLLRSSSVGSESLALEEEADRLRLRRGVRRFLSRSLDLEESELESDPLEESEPELESESESEFELDPESEDLCA